MKKLVSAPRAYSKIGIKSQTKPAFVPLKKITSINNACSRVGLRSTAGMYRSFSHGFKNKDFISNATRNNGTALFFPRTTLNNNNHNYLNNHQQAARAQFSFTPSKLTKFNTLTSSGQFQAAFSSVAQRNFSSMTQRGLSISSAGASQSTSFFQTKLNTSSFRDSTQKRTFANKKDEDYYEILGVPKDATKQTLKKEFYKLVKKWHPDHNKEPGAAEKFKKISEAYEVLSDDKKRQMYDQFGTAAFDEGGFASEAMDPEELLRHFGFGDFFGGFGGMGGNQQQRGQRGADVEVVTHLSFLEAVNGCEKEITFRADVKCDPCNGEGGKPGSSKKNCNYCGGKGTTSRGNGFFNIMTSCDNCEGTGKVWTENCGSCRGKGVVNKKRQISVKIPPGVENGTTVRLAGQGGAGTHGGRSGSAFVRCMVQEDPYFQRKGMDIHTEIPITVSQAILGGTVSVKTLTGEVDVKISPGTQPGEKRVLRGKGVQKFNTGSVGNHYLHFQVQIPKSLSPEETELIKKFAESEKPATQSQNSGIFGSGN